MVRDCAETQSLLVLLILHQLHVFFAGADKSCVCSCWVTAQLGLLNGYLQSHTVNVRLAQCSGWDPGIAYVSYFLDGLLFSLF